MIEFRIERRDDGDGDTYRWGCALCGEPAVIAERMPIVAYVDGRFFGLACLECATNLSEVPERIGRNALEMWRRAERLRDLVNKPVRGLKPGEVSAIFDEMGID